MPTRPGLPRLVRPLQEFISTETSGGVVLVVAALVALLWVNAPFGDSYHDLWNAHLALDLNRVEIDEPLRRWVNDGLMAVFFFVVGLEIKREVLRGELAEPRKAMLPVAAALGGMLVPACLYLALNAGGEGERGWGIPMATDIAFAVGVLSLLGGRVPLSLKVFVLALAIVDDIGAIAVIAVFYTDDLALDWLAAAIGLFALLIVFGRLGVKDVIAYVALGLAAWLAMHESGVHATVAGVVLGLLTPVQPAVRAGTFEGQAVELAKQASTGRSGAAGADADDARAALRELEELSREAQPVLDRLEHALHPWTSFVIVPVFALANAGIEIDGELLGDAVRSPVSWGVALGLVVGKPVGIVLFSFLAIRLGLGALPSDVRWSQLAGAGMIAGIGFTVSIFITDLAFENEELIAEAKIAILAASTFIAACGYLLLRRI